MSHGDTTLRSIDGEHESDRTSERGDQESGVGPLPGRVRDRVPTGALAGLGGAVLVVRGVRRFREGARLRGVLQTALGGVLVGVAVGRRRSVDDDAGDRPAVDQTDVVDTAPDVEDAVTDYEHEAGGHASGEEAAEVVGSSADLEDVASGRERESEPRATGDDAAAVAGSSVDVEDAVADDESAAAAEPSGTAGTGQADEAGSGEIDPGEVEPDESGSNEVAPEADAAETGETVIDVGETDEPDDRDADAAVDEGGRATADEEADEFGDADSAETFDRLGAAAFDAESDGLSAPGEAFDREFLAPGAEVTWGVRESDDAVVLSQFDDPVEAREGTRYVDSTEVTDERTLTVPTEVRDHWDDLDAGVGDDAGDEIVFATSDDLADESLLVVVPERRVGDVLWETD